MGIKENNLFPGFIGWQEGYSAFTYSVKEKHALVKYIENQEAHHKTKTFHEELIDFLIEHGIDFNKKYKNPNIFIHKKCKNPDNIHIFA